MLDSGGVKDQPGAAKPELLKVLPGVVGAALGVAASRWLGPMLWIPGAITVVAALLIAKVMKPPAAAFTPAVSFLFGHMGWLLIGAVMLQSAAVLLDVVFLLGTGLWLLYRPTLSAAVAVAVLQGAAVVLHASQLSSADEVAQKALTVHIGLRTVSAALILVGWRAWRRSQAEAAAPAPELPGAFSQPAAGVPAVDPNATWIKCAQCGLGQRPRPDGCCPRCKTAYGAGPVARAPAPQRAPPAASAWSGTNAAFLGAVIAVFVLSAALSGRPVKKAAASGPRYKIKIIDDPNAPPVEPAPLDRRVMGWIRFKGGGGNLSKVTVTLSGQPVPVDRMGRFEVGEVKPGPAVLKVTAPSTLEKELSVDIVMREHGDVMVPDILLSPAGTLYGRARLRSSTDHSGITVSLEGTQLSTQTDDQGNYVLEDVPAGPYEVVFDYPGRKLARVKTQVFDGQRTNANLNALMTPY